MFALIDCNNFFVSCERIFKPHLKNKPVVVLSNNDGCIIARSAEAKKLGIPMGAPLHEYKSFLEAHGVTIFSANFGLYGDISQRVMHTIAASVDAIEIYSIDEAFLDVTGYQDPYELGLMLRAKVQQWVGIPVSIGIGPTKTLAKLASTFAKKTPSGVYSINDLNAFQAQIFPTLPVQEIWGIGGRLSKMLRGYGIWTAADLIKADDAWLRKKMTIKGLQIAWELRGISCLTMQEAADQKSIICSRSFGHRVTSLIHMKQAVAEYVTRAAYRLRSHKMVTSTLLVYITTSKFVQERYAQSSTIQLPMASDYTPLLIKIALQAVEKIYIQGYEYKKAGVMFLDLTPQHEKQQSLFYTPPVLPKTSDSLMKTLDTINNKWGSSTVQYAATGIEKSWKMKSARKSPAYTTCWDELLTINGK